jgi:hypothetical protein
VTIDDFRKLALELPEATEKSHHDHPDFRVGGKIFATVYSSDEAIGMVKLTPDQQKSFVRTAPETYAPIKGGWGARGATMVRLDCAEEHIVRDALLTAWRNTAPKKLVKALDSLD